MKLTKRQKIDIISEYSHSIIYPENEFSIFNPDVFIENEGYIYELFVATEKEEKDPNILLRRVLFSKLTCIPKTVCILLTDSSRLLDHFGVEECFDNVITTLNSNQIPCLSNCKDYRIISKDIKEYYHGRFFRNYELFTNSVCDSGSIERIDVDFYYKSNRCSWINDEPKKIRNASFKNGTLIVDRSKGGDSFMSSFDNLISLLLLENVAYEDGSFYLNNNNTLNNKFVNVDLSKYAKNLARIEDYAKTLMFAGILPVKATSFDQVIGFEQKIKDFYAKQKR